MPQTCCAILGLNSCFLFLNIDISVRSVHPPLLLPFSLLIPQQAPPAPEASLRYTYDKSKGEVFQQHEANVACVALVHGPLCRTVNVDDMGSHTFV
jgi:hypothetical protein